MVSHSNFEFLVFDYCFEFPEFPDNNKASNVTYLTQSSLHIIHMRNLYFFLQFKSELFYYTFKY